MSYRQAGQVRFYICDAEADLASIADPTHGSTAVCDAEDSQWFYNGSAWNQTSSIASGSTAGVLQSADLLFTETAGAGTYTATLDVAAGTVVLDIVLFPLATWAADTALLNVGDGAHVQAYYSDVDLLGEMGVAYDPTALTSDVNYLTVNRASGDYTGAAYGPGTATQLAGPGVRYPSSDTITATVVTTGAGGTTGRLLVKVLYFSAITSTAAVKS